jgi:hypothetical protein
MWHKHLDIKSPDATVTSVRQMREYTCPLVLSVDDFAMREHTRPQATTSTTWSPTGPSPPNRSC